MHRLTKTSRVDRERQAIRNLASSGKYTRHEIANMTGVRYETVCEWTKYVNMLSQTNTARLSAAAYGRARWESTHTETAEEQDAKLNLLEFYPTDAPSGSREKIEVLRKRVELQQPLWHPKDRADYSGLTGAVRCRDKQTPPSN